MTTCENIRKFIATTYNFTAAGISLGAATVAATTSLGAAVLDASDYDDYSTARAATTGNVGGIIVGGACGFLYGLVAASTQTIPEPFDKKTLTGAVAGANVLAALTGRGVLVSAGYASSALGLGQAAAAAAVGTAIIFPSVALIIAGGIAGATYWATAQAQRDPQRPVANEPNTQAIVIQIDRSTAETGV